MYYVYVIISDEKAREVKFKATNSIVADKILKGRMDRIPYTVLSMTVYESYDEYVRLYYGAYQHTPSPATVPYDDGRWV